MFNEGFSYFFLLAASRGSGEQFFAPAQTLRRAERAATKIFARNRGA